MHLPPRIVSAVATLLACVPCVAQSSGLAPFTEEAASRGVVHPCLPSGSWFGHGLAVNDLDGDGDLDLVLTGRTDGAVALYENTGSGNFIDRSATSGLPFDGGLSGVVAADYDGDADLDLFLSGYWTPSRLLRNDGGLTFTDVTVAAGLGLEFLPSIHGAWGDADGDGWLDLYETVHTNNLEPDHANRFFRNLGDGTFSDVAGLAGLADVYPSFQAVFCDLDRDADSDLYLANDKGYTLPGSSNRHWRNDGGVFEEVSMTSGGGIAIDAMGIALGDIDRNGAPDLLITNTSAGNPLLLNQGDGAFVDAMVSYGVGSYANSWGVAFLDFDHDRRLDIFVATIGSPDRFFSGATLPMSDIAPMVDLAGTTGTWCAVPGDLDGDGDLDLVVQRASAPIRVHINQQGQALPSLKVRLDSPGPNRHGVGATVEVDAGGETQSAPMVAGQGYRTSFPLELHFGLGTATVVDEVRVLWPWGGWNIYGPFPAGDSVVLSPYPDCDGDGIDDAIAIGQGLVADTDGDGLPDPCEPVFLRGDANGNGQIEIADPVLSLGFLFSGIEVDCPSALDADDGGAIDVADPVRVLAYLFTGGAPLVPPFPACGIDPTDDLDCTSAEPCP